MNWRSALVTGCGVLFLPALSGLRAYSAPPIDACSLVTADQVSSVLGVKVGTGQQLSTKLCQWSAPAQAGSPARRVMITLQNPQAFAYAKTPVPGVTKNDAAGIGDDAVYVSAPGAPTTLTVKKGDSVFNVHVTGFPDDQIKAKEKALALDVLGKL